MSPPPVPPPDVLAAAIAVLVAVTVALSLIAGVVHKRRDRAERRRAERWARWEPLLLDVVVPADEPATRAADWFPCPAVAGQPLRAFHDAIGPGEQDDALALLAAFALRLDGTDRVRLAEAAAPLLDRGRPLLHDRRPDRRARAVRLLGLLGTPADHPRIAAALADPSPGVAMTAARALARSRDPVYVLPLLRALGRFVAWGTPAVASMLARYGLHAAPALAAALADAARPEPTRLAAAEALRRLGYYPAASTAFELLTTAPDLPREVTAAALRLLRDLGGPAQAEAARALTDSPDDVVRMHAVSALAAISQQPADAARLEFALGDASTWVALRAGRGLAESGRAASLQRLAHSGDLRAARARLTLAQLGLPPSVPALSELLPDGPGTRPLTAPASLRT